MRAADCVIAYVTPHGGCSPYRYSNLGRRSERNRRQVEMMMARMTPELAAIHKRAQCGKGFSSSDDRVRRVIDLCRRSSIRRRRFPDTQGMPVGGQIPP